MVDEAVMQIGKKGVTPQQLTEIRARLKKKGYIKVKVLKSTRSDLDVILGQVLQGTNARLAQRRGFTFTLKKKER